MTATYESFKFEIADGIAHVTFNQPERGNPMDLRFNTELSLIASECDEDPSARFYAAYTGIGLLPDGGGTSFVSCRVGFRRAAEFFMRNQTWTADEALAAGLISHVVDDAALDAEAWTLARELAAGPTLAFGEIKNLLLSASSQPIEAQMEQEARAMTRVTKSEDGWKGICEVVQRRKPTFVGR